MVKRIRYKQVGAALVNVTPVALGEKPIVIKIKGTEATVYDKEENVLFTVVSQKLITTKIYLRRQLDKQGLVFIKE